MANITGIKSAKVSTYFGAAMAWMGLLWVSAASRKRGQYEAKEAAEEFADKSFGLPWGYKENQDEHIKKALKLH